MSSTEISKRDLSDGMLARVNTDSFFMELEFPGLRDKDNTAFDLQVSLNCRIDDARAFLRDYGVERLKSSEHISITALTAFLTAQCRSFVAERVALLPYADVKDRDACSVQWWQSNLPIWLNAPWLEISSISNVQCESATADRASELKTQQALLDLEKTEIFQRNGHELELKKQQEDHALAKKRIEADRQLSETELQHRLEELDEQRNRQKLQSELDAELARMEAEKKKASLEAEIERIKNGSESAVEILQKAEETEQRNQKTISSIRQAQSELADMAALLKNAFSAGLPTSDRMGVSASGVSITSMELLGETSGAAYLAQMFRGKAASDKDAVLMRKVELSTRDIGTRKVDTLPINSPLQFEFLAGRDGYATILNIGTSGTVWVQSPSAYISPESAQVKSGEKYSVPGSALLPQDALNSNGLDYIEIGPPGWEELIVIISDNPLIDSKTLFHSTPENPFVPFRDNDLETFIDTLFDIEPEQWNVGLFSFLVEVEQ